MKETAFPTSFRMQLAIGVLLVNLVVVALACISVSQNRLQYEERATITTQNLSQVLEEYIGGVIAKIDMALQSAVDESEKQLAGGGINRQGINTYINRQFERISELNALRMTDAKGNILYGTSVVPGVNVSDRDYFIYSHNDSNSGMFISRPVVGRIKKEWTVFFARRYNRPDGSFAGVVFGGLSLDHLIKMFSKINVGKYGTITLFGSELNIIARYPEPMGIASPIGIKLQSTEMKRLFESKQTSATYRAHGTVDDIMRAFSYRKVSTYPMYISVGLAKNDYLAEWQNATAKLSALVALFVSVTFLFAVLTYRKWKSEKRAVEELVKTKDELEIKVMERTTSLREANEGLQTELAERKRAESDLKNAYRKWGDFFNSIGQPVIIMDLMHNILEANNAVLRASGLSIEELRRKKCYEVFHSKESKSAPKGCPYEKLLESGEIETVEMEMEAFGGYYLVSCTPMLDSSGKLEKIIHVATNITERKQAEEARGLTASLLKATLESTADGILVVNTNRQIEDFNKRFLKMWQIPDEVATSKNDRRALDYVLNQLKDPEGFLDKVTQLYSQPEVDSFDTIEFIDGRIFERYSLPQWLNGKVVGRVWSFRDVAERVKADESLRKSEEKYRSLFEESKDVVFISTPEGRYLDINQAGIELFGYSSKEELLDIDIARDLYANSEDRKKYQKILIENGFTKDYELILKRKDGHKLTVLSTSSVIRDAKGSVTAYRGIMRDITEHKKAEELLKMNEENLRNLINSSPVAMVVTDKSGKFIFFNDQFIKMFGYTLNDIATIDDWWPIAYPDEEYRHKVINGWRSAAKKTIKDKKGTQAQEWRVTCKDGFPRDIEFRMSSLEDRNIIIFHDITECKRAEEALRKVNDSLHAILQASPAAIYLMDIQGIVTMWNKAAEQMFGWSEEEAVGRFLPIVPEHKHEEFLTLFKKQLNGEVLRGVELRRQKKDGSPIYISVYAALLYDSAGKIESVVSVVTDITERKALEAQLVHSQKMESVGLLAGGIAHDLNNFLGAMMGYTSLLQLQIKEDDPARDLLDHLPALTERATNLVKNLMVFSRKQVLDIKPTSVNDIVITTGKLLSRVIGEDIKLDLKLSDKDIVIDADAGQIEQALINLVTNARDAMPEGGTLTISTEPFEIDDNFVKMHGYGKPGKYTLLSVEDTGMGMDEETREKIFEPFFTTKGVGKGTGLGLAMVYGTIRQHNGYLNVYSDLGKGTTFRIYLPATDKEATEAKGLDNIPVAGGTETILLVEDEESLRMIMRIMLEGLGYKVMEAEDGNDAVNKFSEHHNEINIVLMDVIMPNKSGKEAYKEMQKIQPDLKVIFTSGHTGDILTSKKIDEEGLAFISKPVSPQELFRKIRDVLDKTKP